MQQSKNLARSTTVLIPCLNEEKTLPFVLREIAEVFGGLERPWTILVIDNGSTDKSREVAQTYGASVINASTQGYGAALQAGIAACSTELAVMGDADGSYRFADSVKMLERLDDGADLVIGNRFLGGIEDGAMPFLHRVIGNPLLSWLGRLLFKAPIGDFHCGIRAFRVDSIRRLDLTCEGMEFASEMIVKACRHECKIEEVPAHLMRDQRDRPPHLRTWTDGWRHLRFLFAFAPNWAFQVPSMLVAATGLVLSVLGFAGGPDDRGFSLGVKTGLVGLAFFNVALVGLWCNEIARFGVRREKSRRGPPTEVLATLGTVLFLIGVGLFIRMIIEWGGMSFGAQAIDSDLYQAIIASNMIFIGGASVFLSLALGALRMARPHSK